MCVCKNGNNTYSILYSYTFTYMQYSVYRSHVTILVRLQVKCLNCLANSIPAAFSIQNATCYIEPSECGNKMLITKSWEGTFHAWVPDVVFTVATVSDGKYSLWIKIDWYLRFNHLAEALIQSGFTNHTGCWRTRISCCWKWTSKRTFKGQCVQLITHHRD